MVFNIFGLNVRVTFQKDLARDYAAHGAYLPEKKQILIDKCLRGKSRMQTILHEFIHAVIDRTGIFQAKLPEGVEEIIADNIATALVENFKITPL